jgi:hypothetical protein
MADEETPETTEETETPAPEAEAPDAPAEETPAAADVEAEEDRPAGDVNPPAPALTRAQQRAASQHAEASKRKPRTPEERQADREERR